MTSQPLRIGLFTPAWPGSNTPNGIATSVYFLAQGLREIGHTPVIVAMAQDGQGPADIPVVAVAPAKRSLVDRLRARLGLAQDWNGPIERRIATAVSEAAREHGLDVLIMEETQGWAHGVEARTGVPVVLNLHGPNVLLSQFDRGGAQANKSDPARDAREARAFVAAPALLAPSRHVLDGIESRMALGDVPRDVIPNSYAAPLPDPLPAALPERDILFIGRFGYLKGGDILLDAFARLTQTHPRARLTFAGPDRGLVGEDGTVRKMADCLAELPPQARDNLTYLGPASREQVAELRASHAIALVASRYENLNYTLLEAMAAGQAIVSTAVGGPAEVLRDGETALLVPSEDPQAMADALARLLDDAALTARLGQGAVDAVQRDFAPAEIARRTVAFLGENGLVKRPE